MCKYGVGVQLVEGESPILDAAVFGRDRKLLLRIFIEKETWLIYNNMTCNWDKRTIEYILDGIHWYSDDDKKFFVRAKESAVISSFLRKIGEKEKGTGFYALLSYINHLKVVRSEKAKKDKEANKEALLNKTINSAPELPEDIEEYIRNSVMVKSRYLFFKTEENKKTGYCTHCSQTVEIPRDSRHKEHGRCPCCGSSVIFMSQRISHKYLVDEDTFTIMQSVNNTFYVRTYGVRWNFSNYLDVKKDIYLGSISYFNLVDKNCFNFVSGWFKIQCGYSFISNGVWYYNTEMFHDYRTIYPLSPHKMFSSKVFRFMKKVWECEELNARVRFLRNQSKVPYIEMMIKNGFNKIAKGIALKGIKDKISINLKGKNISEVFELPRHEINLIKQHDFDLTEVELYKKLRSEVGLKCNDEIIVWVKRINFYGKDRFFELMKHTTPQKLWNYFLKQHNKKNNQHDQWEFYDFLNTWSDYVKICLYLGYDIKESIVIYPRHLKKKHDEVAAIQRQIIEAEQANRRAEAEAAQQKKDRENTLFVASIAASLNRKLAYSNENYLIRAAESVQELLDEGKALNHCVGGYVERIAGGNTAVFFIRSKNEPDKPLCTVEYLPNYERVGQCSGYKNELDNQSVKDFIDEWKEAKKIA